MKGFAGHSDRGTVTDFVKFPEYASFMAKRAGIDTITESATTWEMPQCVEAVEYDLTQSRQELDMFGKALENTKATFTETFITAATPGILSTTLFRDKENPDYRSDEEYVYALAEELRKEYEFIVSKGHILQLDAPDLALEKQIMYLSLYYIMTQRWI